MITYHIDVHTAKRITPRSLWQLRCQGKRIAREAKRQPGFQGVYIIQEGQGMRLRMAYDDSTALGAMMRTLQGL